MGKIYIIIEYYAFMGVEIKTTAYSTKEKAIEDFKSKVEREKHDSWISERKHVIEDETDEFYNAYVDGYASEYETTIWVEEKELM